MIKITKSFLANLRLLAFDVDGTLTYSRQAILLDLEKLLNLLTFKFFIFIIGGGKKTQINQQIKSLAKNNRIFIGSQSGNEIWQNKKILFKNKPLPLFLVNKIKNEIKKSLKLNFFKKIFQEQKFLIYGSRYDFRGCQLTFSFLGQKAPLKEKQRFFKLDQKRKIRLRLLKILKPKFTNIEISIGGLTSLDFVFKKSTKGQALKKLIAFLKIKKNQVLFLGDQIYPYGNDWSVAQEKFFYINVRHPQDTLKLLKKIYDKTFRNL